MQCRVTRTPHADTLLLFFTGWGTTPQVVEHMGQPKGWDMYAFFDYRTVAPHHIPPIEQHYARVYLVAWSMGVWAADTLAPHLPKPTIAIAVNGTPLPMHNSFGIPTPIFEGTLAGLDDDNRARFDRRMCGGKKHLAVYNTFSARSTDDLRAELLGVYNAVKHLPDNTPPQLCWTEALVSEKDLIVPATNQLNYWAQAGIPTTLLQGAGHYPFLSYSTWPELILK